MEDFVHRDGWLWMPVRTKPRQEKKLAEYCRAHQVDVYLPLLRKVHKYRKGKAEYQVPMFPGYIFCQLTAATYSLIVRSNAVLFKIDLNERDEAQLIKELQAIRQLELMASQSKLVVKPELVKGTAVIINSGPFRGIEGIVSFRSNRYRVAINIEMLGQSVLADVDIDAVSKL